MYAFILKIFVMTFLCPMNFLISFEICSTPKLSKQVLLLPLTYKAIHRVSIDLYPSIFITYAPYFIIGKLFLE